MKSLLLLLLGTQASAAHIPPAFLSCSVLQNGSPVALDITTEETEQRAIVYIPSTGHDVTVAAIYTPSSITIPDGSSTWILKRTDLSLQRSVTIAEHRMDYKGKCTVKPPAPQRVF